MHALNIRNRDKATGLDCFSLAFLKQNWDTIKPNVMGCF